MHLNVCLERSHVLQPLHIEHGRGILPECLLHSLSQGVKLLGVRVPHALSVFEHHILHEQGGGREPYHLLYLRPASGLAGVSAVRWRVKLDGLAGFLAVVECLLQGRAAPGVPHEEVVLRFQWCIVRHLAHVGRCLLGLDVRGRGIAREFLPAVSPPSLHHEQEVQMAPVHRVVGLKVIVRLLHEALYLAAQEQFRGHGAVVAGCGRGASVPHRHGDHCAGRGLQLHCDVLVGPAHR